MAYIGYYGDIVFSVNNNHMLTPKDWEREGGSRWHDHQLLHRKPTSQFGGPELEKLKFKIILNSSLGVNPKKQLKRLREIRDNGEVLPLVINFEPVTQNYWRLDSLREGNNFFNGSGGLIHSEAELSLVEYDDSNYTYNKPSLLTQVLTRVVTRFI